MTLFFNQNRKRVRVRKSLLIGHQFVQELMHGYSQNCYELLHLNTNVSLQFCEILKSRNLLHSTHNLTIEKQVAIFAFTVGHIERNRVM